MESRANMTDRRSITLLATGFLLFQGCASAFINNTTTLEVPFHKHEEYHCGTACLQMVMDYYKLPRDRKKIDRKVFIPALKGTTPEVLADAAKSFGLQAEVTTGSVVKLKEWLDNGIPAILLLRYNSQAEVGHFVVVTGISRNNRKIYYHSEKQPDSVMSAETLRDIWEKTGFTTVIVKAPDFFSSLLSHAKTPRRKGRKG